MYEKHMIHVINLISTIIGINYSPFDPMIGYDQHDNLI